MITNPVERLFDETRRRELQQEQFNLALQFYAIEGDTDETRVLHRDISQQMAFNAIDLAFDGLVENIREHGLTEVTLVAPLRGGLGLVTRETKAHLEQRLAEMQVEGVSVRMAAQGVKRHPETDTAEVYFESGYQGRDNSKSHALILDWGTATGLTNAAAAHELVKHGFAYGRITALSMTLSSRGRERMERECPEMRVEAATRAELNADNYVYRIAPDSGLGGVFEDITPKDWGKKMFGMEVAGDDRVEVARQVAEYMKRFAEEFEGFVDETQVAELERFYLQKYALIVRDCAPTQDVHLIHTVDDVETRYTGSASYFMHAKHNGSNEVVLVGADGEEQFAVNELTHAHGWRIEVV